MAGVKNEMLSSIMKLNEIANIVVDTLHGTTEKICAETIVKQGTVLGPILCSTSTAEFCGVKKDGGSTIGDLKIGLLIFVDDTTTIDDNIEDCKRSHHQMMDFTKKKRMTFSYDKCQSLVINQVPTNTLPNLTIYGHNMKNVNNVKFLGDVTSKNGDDHDLIEDRVTRGKSCMISSFSLCNEVSSGCYSIPTLMLLYTNVFLATILYNSQA